MAMQVNLKPLKGEQFKVEIDPEAKVSDLKKKIAEAKPEFPAEQQKLIFSGKILTDDSTMGSLDIKPDGFVVVMLTKAPGAAAAPAAQPAAQPAASPAPAAAPATGATPAAAATPAATGAPAAPLPSVITDLRSNPRFRELAVVVTANPRILQVMIPALRRNYPELQEAIAGNIPGFLRMLAEEAGGTAAGPPAAGGGGEGMPNEAQFRQMAAMLAQNPQMLAQMMQSDPELAAALQANPQAVQQLMAAAASGQLPGMGAGGGGGPTTITLSEADNAAIERLAALGFDKNVAAQAYLACDKNEELAANFLFDGGAVEEEMPEQPPSAPGS